MLKRVTITVFCRHCTVIACTYLFRNTTNDTHDKHGSQVHMMTPGDANHRGSSCEFSILTKFLGGGLFLFSSFRNTLRPQH